MDLASVRVVATAEPDPDQPLLYPAPNHNGATPAIQAGTRAQPPSPLPASASFSRALSLPKHLPPSPPPEPRLRPSPNSYSNLANPERWRPMGLPSPTSRLRGDFQKMSRHAESHNEIEMFSRAGSSTMLANLSSAGDIHVSLPTQPLTLTVAAARMLRPARKTRTDTSGLCATASGLLPSGSGLLGTASGSLGFLDPDASAHSSKGQRLQPVGSLEGGSGGAASQNLSRRATADENERAMAKIVDELKEEMAKIGRERRAKRPSHGVAWAWVCLVVWIAGFVVAAVLLQRDDRQVELLHLYLWRWAVVLACAPLAWVLPQQLMFVVVLVLETQPSSGEGKSQLVYYLMGIRSHAVALLRMLLSLVVMHYVVAGGMDEQYRAWESVILKIWICLSLFFFANVLKSIIARALSRHFHTKSYFERMRDAVQKEYFLLALTKPRRPARFGYDDSLFGRGSSLTRLTAGIANLWAQHSPNPTEGGAERPTAFWSGDHGVPQPSEFGGPPAQGLHHYRSRTLPSIPAGGSGEDSSKRGPGSGGGAALQQGREQRPRQAPEDEAAPLLPGGGPSSSAAPKPGGPSSSAAGAGVSPFDSKPSKAPGAGAGAGAALLAQRHRWGASASEAVGSLRDSWRRAKLLFRHDLKGDVVTTVVGPNGLTAMSPKEAAAAVDSAQAEVGRHEDGRVHGMSLWEHCQVQGGLGPVGPGAGGSGGGAAATAAATAARKGRRGERESSRRKHEKKQEMKMSLFWLEQHIRQNKLRYTTLTDKLGAAADSPDAAGNEVRNKREAKRLAFYVYWNVLGLSLERAFVVPRDLEMFFDSSDEVKACFRILDTDDDGRATLDNIVDAIVGIYKERKKLAITLKDTKSVVAKLELVCGAVIHLGFILLYFWIFEINISNIWVSISTILLSFAFVFGTSVKTLYESVLFLFVVHAFDVGDWLQLGNSDVVKVEEIALLSITCVRADGRRLYIPTAKMMQETTVNLSRSDTFWESHAFLVDVATPASVLEALEQAMLKFTAAQPREFTGVLAVIARALESPSKLKVVVFWEYNHCADDSDRTTIWRSKLLLVACEVLREAGVLYSNPPESPWPLAPGTLFWDPGNPEAPAAEAAGADGQMYLHSRTGAVFARGYGGGAAGGGKGEVRFRGKALTKGSAAGSTGALARGSVAGSTGAAAGEASAGAFAAAALAGGERGA